MQISKGQRKNDTVVAHTDSSSTWKAEASTNSMAA